MKLKNSYTQECKKIIADTVVNSRLEASFNLLLPC